MKEEKEEGGVGGAGEQDESEEVRIECIQSSEFVVGRQSNFNGAVTLINCVEAGGGDREGGEERVVIRDRVVAVSGRKGRRVGVGGRVEKWRRVLGEKSAKVGMASLFVCVVLSATAAVGLVVFFATESTRAEASVADATDGHHFYSKTDWGGKPPRSAVQMKLPIPYVIVSHTVTSRCHSLRSCASLIQNIQTYHLALNYADIAFNFLLDSTGNIYEGRGWHKRNVHGGFVNGRSIDVALIGDYSDSLHPTPHIIHGLRHLLQFALHNHKISPSYSLISANSSYPTLSPGKNVYQLIKHWPHFDPNPQEHVKPFDDR